MTQYAAKERVDRVTERLDYLLNNGVSMSKIASRADTPATVLTELLYVPKQKRKLIQLTCKHLEEACRGYELELGLAKECDTCGKTIALGDYGLNRKKGDGHSDTCLECQKKKQKMETIVKEKKTTAVTAELVKKVKAEDKPEVSAAMLAPYFGIGEAKLLDIREGKYDDLLLAPEPEEQSDATAALNALLKEMTNLRRTVEYALIQAGYELPEVR